MFICPIVFDIIMIFNHLLTKFKKNISNNNQLNRLMSLFIVKLTDKLTKKFLLVATLYFTFSVAFKAMEKIWFSRLFLYHSLIFYSHVTLFFVSNFFMSTKNLLYNYVVRLFIDDCFVLRFFYVLSSLFFFTLLRSSKILSF